MDGNAVIDRLRAAGLRPTRQRVALAGLLFARGNRHVDAETLAREAREARVAVSLATVYNTLNQLVGAGLLRRLDIEPGRTLFDTNLAPHHHFYDDGTGELTDFDAGRLSLSGLPRPPRGKAVEGVDVVVRIR